MFLADEVDVKEKGVAIANEAAMSACTYNYLRSMHNDQFMSATLRHPEPMLVNT